MKIFITYPRTVLEKSKHRAGEIIADSDDDGTTVTETSEADDANASDVAYFWK